MGTESPTEGATYEIRFVNASPDEGNLNLTNLRDFLRDIVPRKNHLAMERKRENANSQDFGATLVLVLGTAAATAVAQGIRTWLAAHTGTTIEITDAKGQVVARNINSASAAEIAKVFAQRPTE